MGQRFITANEVEAGSFPWCTTETLSNEILTGAERLILVRATFPGGEAHNFHKHPGREEIIYVLLGKAEHWVGKEKRVLGPGEIAHIPPNTPHATYNPFDEELTILAMLSPVDAEGEFTIDVSNEEPWRTICPPIRYDTGS
jgi:quercetin dioxygenase-like cupin family protein